MIVYQLLQELLNKALPQQYDRVEKFVQARLIQPGFALDSNQPTGHDGPLLREIRGGTGLGFGSKARA